MNAVATWTFPLTITVRVGPSADGAVQVAAPRTLDLPEALVEARKQLKGRNGVIDVRAGYRFRDGWITEERVIVALVRRKRSRADLAHEGLEALPTAIGGFPIDVSPISPWDLLDAERVRETLEALPRIHYRPPEGVALETVEEEMTVHCHVSPDAGWPTLEAFLGQTKQGLTVGIYYFTAPHILKAIQAAVRARTRKLRLILQRNPDPTGGTKADDLPDEKVVDALRNKLGDRFDQAWAVVTGPRQLFASSYHIKVAVRDGQAFWLSSGNWQSSNQPDADPLADEADATWTLLRSYNREWHAVVENAKLAHQYEQFLLSDLRQAQEAVEESRATTGPMVLVAEEAIVAEEAPVGPPRFFPALTVTRKVRVTPLLTPDNYQPAVLDLLDAARRRICFQNQSLNLAAGDNDSRFEALVQKLLDKQRSGLDVRMILRGDFNPRPTLEKLQGFGFDMRRVKVQKGCHTKGIIVDSERVLLGSHNWTNQGTLVNRDASLIFDDEEIARYYEAIFEHDWTHLAVQKILEGPAGAELARPGVPTPAGMVAVPLGEIVG